ncbi:MAG: hypothetical protein ACI9SE_000539 [Neolewinella sp.]|jgi:hypothetical protein
MKTLSLTALIGLTSVLSAQTTLTVDPTTYTTTQGLTYSNPGANFFDLTVISATGVTLRALEIPTQEPAGTTGTIELWINTTAASHIGNENLGVAPAVSADPSGWQLLTTGDYTSGGFAVSSQTCQSAFTINVPDTFLATGTFPMAIVYVGVSHQFQAVTAYPAPAGTFSDGALEVTNGSTQSNAWIVAPLNALTFGGANYAGTMPEFGITYEAGAVGHACAESEVLRTGSIEASASFFDLIEDSVNTKAALEGTSIEFVNTSTGYVIQQGTATFRPNSGIENVIPAVDDGENQITLPTLPVVFPTGAGQSSTMDLFVHSNGYISTATQSALFFAPLDPASAMNADAMAWYGSYHDFNPTEVGSGQILWEEDLAATPNPTLYVTWDNVESYPVTGLNPSIVQYQFDLITGNVAVVYQLIDGVGGSTFAGGDDTLIGWSPAGASPATAEIDYTALVPTLLQLPEQFPLKLEAVGPALLGGSVVLETSAEVGSSFGLVLLNTGILPVSLPLPGVPPQTLAHLDVPTSVLFSIDNLVPGVPNMSLTIPLSLSPALIGFELYAQSFWFDLNSILTGTIFPGLTSSNAIRIKVGNI